MKKRVLSTAIAAIATIAVGAPAQASVTPQQGMADLFSVFVWSSPAKQEQQLCAAFKKTPAKAAAQVQRAASSAKSLQTQLGLTRAQLQSAAVNGMRNACGTSPTTVVQEDAVEGIMIGVLGALSAADVSAVCSQFESDQASVVTTFAKSFNSFPVPAADVTSGVTSALQSTCSAS